MSTDQLRIAIVGSGPSGFYAAEALFKAGVPVVVDLFERLPTPYGLVRGGVAPDHPKINTLTKAYEKLATSQPTFSFWGNVTIGRDLSIEELRRFYDAVVLTTGAQTDRRMGVPGEDLPGSHTATELVAWYNGHPDYRDRRFDLSAEVAVVVGQGNVAMDVSRILAKTVDELRSTDIAEHALDALASSRIREIWVVGRRGPAQAKFTPPELRELGALADCEPVVDPSELVLGPSCQAEHDDPGGMHCRGNLELLRAYAQKTLSTGKSRRLHLRFFLGPVEVKGAERVEAIVLEKNRLEGEPFAQRAVGTGERTEVPCGLVFRSVGYKGVAIPGAPFDERNGVVPNEGGRVVEGGAPIPGLYCAGWIKRGPSGVIGTNKACAVDTIEKLLADVPSLPRAEQRDGAELRGLLASRGVRVVTFSDWQKIDAAEIELGRARGKPREKLTRWEELLARAS